MERTLKLTAASVWMVISGCIAIGGGAWMFAQAPPPPPGPDISVGRLFGPIFIAVGVLVLLGGIFALKRRWWVIVLLGAILSLAVFFPANSVAEVLDILAIILGILSIIFVSKSKGEFY